MAAWSGYHAAEVSRVKPPPAVLADRVAAVCMGTGASASQGLGSQRESFKGRDISTGGAGISRRFLRWRPVVDASCQMVPRLWLSRAPTPGLLTWPGLPPSTAVSGHSDCLQGRTGPQHKRPREQGQAASTLLT